MSSTLFDLGRLVFLGLAATFYALFQGHAALVAQGGETSVSGAISGDQVYPALALGVGGGYVAWQDNVIDTNGWGIAARRLDAQGAPSGVPFRVNSTVADNQERPQVALTASGGAVFVWQGGPVGFQTVSARFLSPSGSFLAGDSLVSQRQISSTNRSAVMMPVVRNNRRTLQRVLVKQTTAETRDFSANPVAASLASGDVIIAYAGYQRFTTNYPVVLPMVRFVGSRPVTNSILANQERVMDLMLDVFFRRYTQTGAPVGGEARVNLVTKYNQRNPAVAALDNGNFVVVWVSENHLVSDGDLALGRDRQDVFARLFNPLGHALSDEIQVSDPAVPVNTFPSVAPLAGGGFRVAWAQSVRSVTKGLDVMTRALDAYGNPLAAPVRVNTFLTGDQYAPKVASCPAGELIVWTSLKQDGSDEGVFGQWMAGGALTGAEFRVNTSIAGRQYHQALAATPDNRILAVWAGLKRGTGFDVFGQSYSASNP